jgi:hypothetical protein
MTSRFNGANTAGVTTSTNFPATATQDSLFGNTEAFNNLSNIKPEFKLTGLDPNFVYSFTIFASRNGVTDNRETHYTVTGATTAFADLNASNNANNFVTVNDIRPTASGEISIALTPTPNNNNANHFTYLGAMRVDFRPFREPRLLFDFGAPGRPTTDTSDPDNVWNNVTTVATDKSDGYSIWGQINVNPTWAVFARYDSSNPSKDLKPKLEWTYYNAGVQWTVNKAFAASLVYKYAEVKGGPVGTSTGTIGSVNPNSKGKYSEFGVFTVYNF